MHLHFLGISGTLMCGAAKLAMQLGFEVSGSDRDFYPPMGDTAKSLGVPLFVGYDADVDARPADCYIVGNAISRGNPLMESIMSRRRPYVSAAQWLGENVLSHRNVIAVAGTHGKTTTACLLAWILERAGLCPGFLLGGVPQNFTDSARLGEGDIFVIEADEYDSAFFDKRPKFLHYRPSIALLNNLEFDHADIYDSIDDIILQFHYFLRTIADNGKIITRADDDNLTAALNLGVYSPVVQFGGSSEWRHEGDDNQMCIYRGDEKCCSFVPPLIGEVNRDNILAAVVAAHYAGANANQADEWISGFLPPRRRLQQIADGGGVLLYDDFAHHPTAYKRTLAAVLAAHSGRRIVAVFEPRSNTMKKGIFAAELSAAFEDAGRVVVVGDYPWLAEAIAPLGERATVCETAAVAADLLQNEMQNGDIIVLMSNGDFGGLAQTLAAVVNKNNSGV